MGQFAPSIPLSSCPDLIRASTGRPQPQAKYAEPRRLRPRGSSRGEPDGVDARIKSGHDDGGVGFQIDPQPAYGADIDFAMLVKIYGGTCGQADTAQASARAR